MTFDSENAKNETDITETTNTKTTVYCSRCAVAETSNTSGLCDDCQRTTEVDALLAKNGVTAEQVTADTADRIEPTGPSVFDDDIPIGTTYGNSSKPAAEPVATNQVAYTYEDPGPNWLDELGESYKLARDGADEVAPEFVDFPTSLIRSAVKESNVITKRDIESVMAEFTMNVSLGQYAEDALSLIVTDITDKAGMKKARELRLVGKRERVRFDQQGAEAKEPYLRRGQLIDGIRRAVRLKFEACEAHLLEQEQFEERELARIAAETQVARIADLAQFEWLADLDDVKRAAIATDAKLGYMNETEWLAYRSTAETAFNEKKEAERLAAEAKRAEDERLERENARLQEVNRRVAELTKLGLNYDGVEFTCGEITIALANIEHATDDAFDRLMVKLTPQVEAIKTAEFAADQERLRLKNEAETERRKAEETQAELDRIAAEKKAEEERIAAEAEAARLAPDKEKLDVYFRSIHDATANQPDLESDSAKQLLQTFFAEAADLVNRHAEAAAKLEVSA